MKSDVACVVPPGCTWCGELIYDLRAAAALATSPAAHHQGALEALATGQTVPTEAADG